MKNIFGRKFKIAAIIIIIVMGILLYFFDKTNYEQSLVPTTVNKNVPKTDTVKISRE